MRKSGLGFFLLVLALLAGEVSAAPADVATAASTDVATTAATDAVIPSVDFVRRARVMSPRLSPDGQHLSLRMDDGKGDEHVLVIYRLSDMHVTSILRMPKNELPLNTVWVSPTRLVISKGKAVGSLGTPEATGELIALDFNGEHQEYLYGYHPAGRKSRTRNGDRGFGAVDGLPEKPNGHFYMSVRSWDTESHSWLYDVDAVENSRHLLADMNLRGMNFLVDPHGEAAYAYGTDAEGSFRAFRKQGKGWAPIPFENANARFDPIAYTPDHQSVYALISKHGEPMTLVTEKLDGSARQQLAGNDFGNVAYLQWSAPPWQPFGVAKLGGKPETVLLKPEFFEARVYAKLTTLFPGQFVDFINFSQDGGKLLFSVASDRDPGAYYLLDTKTLKVTKLFDVMPWIKPGRMAERRPIRFKASDGMELDGYLTFPPHRGESNLPLVLLPHGGPHGVRDSWFYDSDAQFLASRGYLVLQVNYRGSGGRGVNFREAGYLKWGTRIQQDLIDGVKWTIAGHYADPKRICTYGASFGGYAAMMSVVRAPKLFKCAIGYAGIYDLAMTYNKGDIRLNKSGRNYLNRVIGENDAALDNNSPDKLTDKIDVPVLLIHGKDDQRAPYAQAVAMRDALTKAGNPPQWLVKSHEGHGFYNEENGVEVLDSIAAFLEKNIGKGAPIQH